MSDYKRITPKDLVEVINMPQGEDMTKFVLYAQRLWELENQIESGEYMKPPCKYGDKLYWVYSPSQKEPNEIVVSYIQAKTINEELCWFVFDIYGAGGRFGEQHFKELDWYLGADKSYAENFLKEIQGEQ